MSGARALQKVLKVACLGPEFSYSHLASVERFGQAVEFSLVGSIPAVFEAIYPFAWFTGVLVAGAVYVLGMRARRASLT